MGMNNIVPLAVKARRLDVNIRHLLISDLSSRRVNTSVKPAGHGQSLGGGGARNKSHHGLVVSQRFAAPVGTDEREQAMLHLVPLAGPRGKMAHRDRKFRLVCQALQLQLPQAQPVAVAAAEQLTC